MSFNSYKQSTTVLSETSGFSANYMLDFYRSSNIYCSISNFVFLLT